MKALTKIILPGAFLFFATAAALPAAEEKPAASNPHKQVADKFIEIWNNGKLDELSGIVDPNFVRKVNEAPDVKGLEGLKKVMTEFRTAYPDCHLTVDDEFYAKDRGAIRWTFKGTNTGPGAVAPTGKAVKVSGITILHFANGKITEEVVAYDAQSMMEQLGNPTAAPAKG